ncbi:hypothetical protein AB1Y20_016130 [Prymnesium parvum]|uniref:Uncharacterized protein n=1 Tax=Prymnesium parvum TaxID=97485 RepID=A0AB34K0H5_PRYPA
MWLLPLLAAAWRGGGLLDLNHARPSSAACTSRSPRCPPPLLSSRRHLELRIPLGTAPLRLSRVEVWPPVSAGGASLRPSIPLSEAAVANIFELVWRDTRMLFSTAQKRPIAVAWELAWERVPVAVWFIRHRCNKLELDLNYQLEQSALFRCIAPQAAKDLKQQRQVVERRLQESRSTLWPTLRTLLMRPSTHLRVLQAARTQLAIYKQFNQQKSGFTRVVRAPLRVAALWAAMGSLAGYGLRWLWLSLDRFGLGMLTEQKQQRLRSELIEWAVQRGVELQRQIDRIDQNTFLVDAQRLLRAPALPATSKARRAVTSRRQPLLLPRLRESLGRGALRRREG